MIFRVVAWFLIQSSESTWSAYSKRTHNATQICDRCRSTHHVHFLNSYKSECIYGCSHIQNHTCKQMRTGTCTCNPIVLALISGLCKLIAFCMCLCVCETKQIPAILNELFPNNKNLTINMACLNPNGQVYVPFCPFLSLSHSLSLPLPLSLTLPSQRHYFISEENLWKLLKHTLQSICFFFLFFFFYFSR